MRFLLLCLLLCLLLPGMLAAQVRVLVIGDSLSAEYEYETPFSAPDSDPFNANTMNWIEILDAERGDFLDFGDHSSLYPDLRGPGFEYNWGVPGAETEFWAEVFASTALSNFAYWTSKLTLLSQRDEVDVVVVLLGGNDVNSIYGELYNNTPPADFPAAILDHFEFILGELRDGFPDLPIVLVNAPDVGATPDVIEDHPDPAKRADASAHIAALNAGIANLAGNTGATLVDFFSLTTGLGTPDPFFIGSLQMVKSSHPENPPTYLFCKLKFHPASGLNALFANHLVEGITAQSGMHIPLLENREIISDVLGLNPDQPLLDWLSLYPGASASGDDDRDSLPTLGEFALGTNPLLPDAPELFSSDPPPGELHFTPNPAAARYVDVVAEESLTLQTWTPVPPARLEVLPDGSVRATLPNADRAFGRLRFPLLP